MFVEHAWSLRRGPDTHKVTNEPSCTLFYCTAAFISQLLDVPGLDSRRRRPPQEVANEQQARDLDIPAGVNVQRSASPGEIHRRVRDERMTQRLRQYEVGLD